MWELPTMQNRQIPPCNKSRRHLYPTDYWNTAQALTNQRQQLKLEWSLVSARPAARDIKMRAPRHIGTIHGYAINKRTPALLTTSQTGSARNRQHRHHLPVAAALSTRVLLGCETTEPLPQRRLRLGCAKRRTPFSEPQFLPTASQLAATQRAPPGVQPAARPDKKKIALFRATVSADSQSASRYAARSARCTARCSAGQK
jgi:hypothetical protein